MQMETAQLIILIILIIIGIVLFVVFLVELVNIPKPLITPFADGSIIRIRSLANNLYLKPISCASISTCAADNEFIANYCSSVSNGTIVAAIGQAEDPQTRWQLCQYSALSDDGEAKYVIYPESNQNVTALSVFQTDDRFGGVVHLQAAGGVCNQIKAQEPQCNSGVIRQHFSFILNEKATGNNTTSGSYNIISSCEIVSANGFIYSNGIGATSLPATVCPPLVLTQQTGGIVDACPSPDIDARCTLSYLFEIEVVS